MKGSWAELIGKARQLESAIQQRLEARARSTSQAPRQPLETVHAIVRAVEAEVQPVGRGKFVFPYGQVRVWLAAASPRERARLAAACEGPPTLDDRVRERLAALGCDAAALQVKTMFAAAGKAEWTDSAFHIEYVRAPASVADVETPARLELTVLQGTAERSSYTFATTTISLGRGTEVRDERNRLLRTNHVVFVERAGEINASVSRRHAHITRAATDGGFRLHDDGSSQGTSVMRDGRDLPVTRARGLRLRSGDVIVLGQARVRVRLP